MFFGLLFYAAVFLMIGGAIGGVVVPVIRRARIRRELRAGSSTMEHGAAVTLIGTVREKAELLGAPLSGRRCVAYSSSAQLTEYGANNLPVVLSATSAVPFELDTVTAGIVLVDTTSVAIGIKPVAPKPRRRDLEEAFMVANGRGAMAALAASFREVLITPGMRIAVYGEAMIEDAPDAERGYRDGVPTRSRIVPMAGKPIAIGDPPPP